MQFEQIYRYNRWANLRLLDAAAAMPEATWTAPVVSSFPSLAETFAHVVGVEWIWWRRCSGETRPMPPEWMHDATPAILSAKLDAIFDGQRQLLGQEDRRIRYVNIKGEPREYGLREILFHVPNHSTYHRGQIVTIMRQLGAAPPATDFVVFVDAAR